jgi:2,3-bisphosphoglycerate-dependent phosphoglycerate mutase
MQTRVWLMRHAQTNPPDVFHGFESDADLSELGYRQAAVVAPVVAAYRPDVVISSGMVRARRTAEPIAQLCGLPLLIEPHLHERKVGALSGTPVQPELGGWPDTLNRWIAGDTSYAPEGAESFDAVQARVLPVWDRVTVTHSGKSIVIVCHGNVSRVLLLSLLKGYSVSDWMKLGKFPNISISELVGAGREWTAHRISEVPLEARDL